MNRSWTKVYFRLLLTVGVIAAFALAVPDMVLMGLFLFILPGMILALSPTVFLYLLIFGAPWLAFRRMNPPFAVAAGVVTALSVAYGVPMLLNERTQRALDAAAASDLIPAQPIAPAHTIALLPESGYAQSAESCSDLCLLLLYNGVAERVISLAPQRQRRAQATLFRIERLEACDAGRLADRTWTTKDTAEAIVEAARLRVAAGECLIAEPPGDAVPDLTIIRRADVPESKARERVDVVAGRIESHWIEMTAGGSLIARAGKRRTRMLLSPLFLNLAMRGGGGGFDVGPWEWGKRDADAADLDTLAVLGRVTSFDLSIPSNTGAAVPTGTALAIPNNAGLDPLRQHIDALLDDVTIDESDGRFALIGDYYETLGSGAELQPGDAERLVRLIADDRVKLFVRFPWAALRTDEAPARFRDVMLARLSRLPPEEVNTTYTLQKLAAQLPAGAYRNDYDVLDNLLATRQGLQRFPALIPRLADRGNSVVPRLLATMREWREEGSWRSGGVAVGALQGLCMLGPDAASALPALRQMAVEGIIPPNMQRGDRWRMSMVKIGASANEFEKPSNISGSQSRYEERLARDAQRRSCTSF